MSIYYSPQIVKLLTNERVEEALRAGQRNRTRSDEQVLVSAQDRMPVVEDGPSDSRSNDRNC